MTADSAAARPPVPASLVTDLYELTMAAAYQAEGIEHEATFELFVRRLPAERRFLVAAGLDDALAGLEALSFAPHEVHYLAGLELLPASLHRPAGRPPVHGRGVGGPGG